MHWFRWHHGTVNDPKWRVIGRRARVPQPYVIAVWAAMLECASQAKNRGDLDGWNAEDVAAGLNMKPEQVQAIYDAMQGKTLEGDRLINWEKRQPKREDNTAAERKRQQRAREKEVDEHADVTHGHATSRIVTVDENRGNESREECVALRDTPTSALTPTQETERSRLNIRGTRLTITDLPHDWRAWALKTGHPDPHAEWEQFRDYWISKTGQNATKANWEATWRIWVRRALQNGKPAVGSKKPEALEPVQLDASLEAYREKLERYFDKPTLRSWFKDVAVISEDDGYTLIAGSDIVADYIKQHFVTEIRVVFGERVRFEVRKKAA